MIASRAASGQYRQLKPAAPPLRLIKRHWPLVAAWLVLWATIAALAALTIRGADGHFLYGSDGAYLHMAVARNLLQTAVWGIDGRHFAPLSSSPLYTVLLATSFLFCGVRETLPLLLNTAFATGCLAVVYIILRGREFKPWFMFGVLVAVLLMTAMPAMALRGTEHCLLMLLAVLFAHHAVRALRREIEGDDMRQRELAAATITALTLAPLLVLAHHDGIYFVLLTILLLAWRRRFVDAAMMTAAGGAPLVLCAVFSNNQGWPSVGWQPLAHIAPDIEIKATLGAIAMALVVLFLARRNILTLRRAAADWQLFLAVPGVLVLLDGRAGAAVIAAVVAAALTAPLQTGIRGQGGGAHNHKNWQGWAALAMAPLVLSGAYITTQYLPAAKALYLSDYQVAHFLRANYTDQGVLLPRFGCVAFYTRCRVVAIDGSTDLTLTKAKVENHLNAALVESVCKNREVALGVVPESAWLAARAPEGAPSSSHLPPGCVNVGAWVTSHSTRLIFVAANSDQVGPLRAHLAQFSKQLPRAVTTRSQP